jgi:hypothetical protein
MIVLAKKYERLLVPTMLVGGFAIDVLTFRYVEVKTVFMFLVAYAILAGAAIVLVHNVGVYKAALESRWIRFVRGVSPSVLQFSLGALLSSSLVFYWFSGAISASWPLIFLIAGLAVGNETFRNYYLRPIVQIPIYFFTLFSLFALALPFIFNTIAPWLFYSGGCFSLFAMLFFIRAFSKINNVKIHQRKYLVWSVLSIFVVMNALYYFNFIPPIPLSIREAGAYHRVSRVGGNYILSSEKESFVERVLPGQTLHIDGSDRVYVFTSIFAPSDLDTRIYHRWKFYDEEAGEWIERGLFSYSLFGGRQDGYRGFSYKTVSRGKWRVEIETSTGQTLGRVRFDVVEIDDETEFVDVTTR